MAGKKKKKNNGEELREDLQISCKVIKSNEEVLTEGLEKAG